MRTPDGWQVEVISMREAGRSRQYVRVRLPNGIHLGTFADPDEALAAMRDAGGEPADLLDYVGR